MKILFLSQLLPYPPDAGAKVRSYYTLRWLAQQHRITLATFTRPGDPPEALEHLRSFCQAVHTVPIQRGPWRDALSLAGSLLSGRSFIIHRDRSAAMDAILRRLAREEAFDAVHADQLWMAQYVTRYILYVRAMQHFKVPRTALDEHNACYQIFERLARKERHPFKRWLWQREAGQLRRYEAAICREFDRVVTVTPQDQVILQGLVGAEVTDSTHYSTIPICVDTSSVSPVLPQGNGLNVLHLGTMFWPPNVEGVTWFLRHAWPLVRQKLPLATFSVVGKNPPGVLAALANGQGVELAGYVPDPQPWLERAGVFVVPLLSGGGMRVKIVDAWRWGLPVVSTTLGAEGIDYVDGEHLLIADDAASFAAAVVRLLTDPALNHRLRGSGRRWVEQRYDWRAIYSAWDAVYA